MRRLIVTADDFGLALPVNEAVERGYREGVLSTASLMVAAPATSDAIERARRLPGLAVGLHVVLVNGRPKLPPERIPLLVGSDGEFQKNLFAAGMRYFFLPGVRKQLEDEIRAQFAAFAHAGLRLDHVNAQNHLHVHPTVLSLIMRVGRQYGMRAVRVPYEPALASWRAMRGNVVPRAATALGLAPWLMLMRARLRRNGITTNDYVFGMHESGRMTAQRVRKFIENLPHGTSEVYVHPATQAWPGAEPPDYDFAGEFNALIDPLVIAAARSPQIERTTFLRLAGSHAS
ncbi:MAG TPA: hopanoid biosynthesis-associated protein HpnK [Candidatus Baltobacteraceae bacterium]|nr:hopanoid biosynthesis-associated protein HpnK [Candidatus Baltobacteraceae bacterium]